jgi:hypothetical protein
MNNTEVIKILKDFANGEKIVAEHVPFGITLSGLREALNIAFSTGMINTILCRPPVEGYHPPPVEKVQPPIPTPSPGTMKPKECLHENTKELPHHIHKVKTICADCGKFIKWGSINITPTEYLKSMIRIAEMRKLSKGWVCGKFKNKFKREPTVDEME